MKKIQLIALCIGALSASHAFALSTETQTSAPAITEVARAPWIRCTPTSYSVDGGAPVTSANPLAEGLRFAEPGSLVEVEAGYYPVMRLWFGRGETNADCSGTEFAPITIRAAHSGPNRPRIMGGCKSDALMIDQIKPVEYITFEGFEIQPGYRSGVIFYQQKGASVHRGFRFVDCDIIGQWDHLKATGQESKWGVYGQRLADFEWKGVTRQSIIRDIKNEHGFYLQNSAGDITIENVEATRLGRTFVQFTARSKDGPQGIGQVVVRNCRIADTCIGAGDAYKGGSAFTVSGNMPKAEFLFEGNSYRAGFDPTLKKLTPKGKPYGTGALVVWYENETVRVGKVVLRNNDFRMAADSGDRPLVALSAAKNVVLEGTNHFEAGAFGVALSIDPPRGNGLPNPLSAMKVRIAAGTEFKGRVEFEGKPALPDKRQEWGLGAE